MDDYAHIVAVCEWEGALNHGKIEVKGLKHQVRNFSASTKAYRHCGLYMYVLNAIKRNVLWFIGSLESCMQKNQGPNSGDQ